jgi:predicted XRE-type DNA-binding protein
MAFRKKKTSLSTRKFLDYEVSSGNVFRDLGLPNAEELSTKARLAIEIGRIISKRGLSQTEAAKVLGLDQPKVSAIVRGRLDKFSVERLCQLLTRLGCDIDIQIREKHKSKPGRLIVKGAH